MSTDHFADPIRRAGRAFQKRGGKHLSRLMKTPLDRWRYRGAPAEKLLLVPRDLHTADPSFISEIMSGHFGLAGIFVDLDPANPSPFVIVPPNEAWARELHGFSWLRHLRADASDRAISYARGRTSEWISAGRPGAGTAWQPAVVGRRLISWLTYSSFLLRPADQDFYEDFMRSLSRQARFLAATRDDSPAGQPRLTVLIALMMAGLCVDEQQRLFDGNVAWFATELDRQILPDGGHISRNQKVLIDLLCDLLPLRECFKARDIEAPAALDRALFRMIPMVRYARLDDANLARFNGVGASESDLIAAVLAYDDVDHDMPEHAASSGYCRLDASKTTLMIDVGPPPPVDYSKTAHAGCTSLEFCAGGQPIIVNCGAPPGAETEWLKFARSTLSHSTLTIDNASSGSFKMPGGMLLRRNKPASGLARAPLKGPKTVAVNIERIDGFKTVRVSHDGYQKKFGITHERLLRLGVSGARLEGEDRIIPAVMANVNCNFAIRFHLHPDIEVDHAAESATARLILATGEIWTFSANGAALSLTESRFLAFRHGPVKTKQLVLKGLATGAAVVRWVLQQQGKSEGEPTS